MARICLHYTVHGQGRPVIFLHGFMEDSSMWDNLIQKLHVKAYCIDLHGHGQSEFISETSMNIRSMAEQVFEIVKKEQLEDAIVVGHSLGGYVALELYELNNSFEHIVLFHSHPWNDSIEKQQDRERVANLVMSKKDMFIQEAIPNLFYLPKQHKEAISKYINMAKNMSTEAIAWNSLAMKNRNDNSHLLQLNPSRFTCIIGLQDKLVNVELLISFCKKAAINVIELAHVGHMAHEEAPEKTEELFKLILH